MINPNLTSRSGKQRQIDARQMAKMAREGGSPESPLQALKRLCGERGLDEMDLLKLTGLTVEKATALGQDGYIAKCLEVLG